MAASGLSAMARHAGTHLGPRRLRADRLPRDLLFRGTQVRRGSAEEPGRGRSQAARNLRQARHPAARARAPCRCCRGRRIRQRVRRNDVQGQAVGSRRDFLLVLRGCERPPGTRQEIPRQRRPAARQLLCGAQLGRIQRRVVRLRPERRALPDGAVHLLPDQRREHGAVRAHADRGGRRQLRQLPRRLHGPNARREPAARGRRRTRRPGRCRNQVLHRAELVSGRRRRQRRDLQLRDQTRRLPRPRLEDLVDPGGNRLGHYLEVSELHTARRELRRRILLGSRGQQPAAGRYRHEDDSHRQKHAQHDRLEGHFRRQGAERLPRPREDPAAGERRT